MKLEALLASAGTLALVWRCARARGLAPVPALLAVGANPLYVIYGLGGAHNDLLMMLAMMAAVALMLTPRGASPGPRREAGAAAVLVAGALVKATVGALLPFMIIARRRLAPVVGALAALAARRAGRLRRVRLPRRQHRRGAEPRRGAGLDRQLPERDRAPVRQARRVPDRPRPAEDRARADRGASGCGAPGAATTGSPPRAGRCWRSRSRARGCSPGTSCGRCRSRSSAATGGCCSPRSRCRGSTWSTSSRRWWCR